MMLRDETLMALGEVIEEGDIVVAVYQSLFDWMEIKPRDLNYVATGAMGQASSHGLGLALANPERRVFVFDGDGSLLMNLGTLATIGEAAPENLYHLVFANGTYEVNGGHPVPGGKNIDFASIAKACGYPHSFRFSSLRKMQGMLAEIISCKGPVFMALDIEPGKKYPWKYDYIHSSEARDRFRRALNQG